MFTSISKHFVIILKIWPKCKYKFLVIETEDINDALLPQLFLTFVQTADTPELSERSGQPRRNQTSVSKPSFLLYSPHLYEEDDIEENAPSTKYQQFTNAGMREKPLGWRRVVRSLQDRQ